MSLTGLDPVFRLATLERSVVGLRGSEWLDGPILLVADMSDLTYNNTAWLNKSNR